jgi:hypothetical protein
MATCDAMCGYPESAKFGFDRFPAPKILWRNTNRQADEAKRGSFRYLCIRYYSSAAFKTLDISTRNWQRRALDEISRDHGAKPVALMEPRHVRRIRDAKIDTPAAANQRLKALRTMFSWANEAEENDRQPDNRCEEAQIHVERSSYLDT